MERVCKREGESQRDVESKGVIVSKREGESKRESMREGERV